MKILLILYDFILILCIPFYFIFLFFKNKFSFKVFRRFNSLDENTLNLIKGKETIWIHAVSLGEVLTCKTLINELSSQNPERVILITTITTTGKIAAEKISENNVTSLFLPFDISFLISHFIKKINPKMLILMETELWPNLLYYIERNKIPVLVLNARLSDRSFNKYRFFSWFVRNLTKDIKIFCVQSQIDMERFLKLGIVRNRVKVAGNMKFDAIGELSSQELLELDNLKRKIALRKEDFFIVAGSTHNKEEGYVIDAFIALKKEFSNLRLLIAPRHLEKLNIIEAIIKDRKLKSERMSEVNLPSVESILLLDMIGKLKLIYSLADLVFVGGSLVPVGGHNILEPAFFGKPIIVGPCMHNFREITQLFLSANALIQVKDNNGLMLRIKELILGKDKLIKLGSAAKAALISNQGATKFNLGIIKEISNESR